MGEEKEEIFRFFLLEKFEAIELGNMEGEIKGNRKTIFFCCCCHCIAYIFFILHKNDDDDDDIT